MRSPIDLCLLCDENPATVKNSHILSKFISTGFLISKDGSRRGYKLDSATFSKGKKKIVQDSPKEHYVLCEDCESYFSVLEAIASRCFKNWKEKMKSGEYSMEDIGRGGFVVNCDTAHKRAIHLFLYSLFWRADISSLDTFANFKIEDSAFKEALKEELRRFRKTKEKDFVEILDSSTTFKIFPSGVFTVYSMSDPTENLIMILLRYPYQIVTDSFVFYLFKDENDIENKELHKYHNLKEEDCRIIVFPESLWKKVFLHPAHKPFAEQAVKNPNK